MESLWIWLFSLATREKLVDRKSEWNIIDETTSQIEAAYLSFNCDIQRNPPPNVPVSDEW